MSGRRLRHGTCLDADAADEPGTERAVDLADELRPALGERPEGTVREHEAVAVHRDGLGEAWIERLDEIGIEHSPVIDATRGWIVVFHDPDGLELHLYTEEMHHIDQSSRPGYGRPVRIKS